MTRLMEQAIDRLRAIPEAEQDGLARFLLQEIEDDARWESSTAASEVKLKDLVDRVFADDAGGGCKPLDPDRL